MIKGIKGTAAVAMAALAGVAQADTACDGVFSLVQVSAVASELRQAPPRDAPMAVLSSRSKPHVMVDARVLGSTTATRASFFQYRYRVAQLPDGSFCVQPKVDITLAYQPLVVEVASELAQRKCLRDMVLQHEREHVHAYRAHLSDSAQELARSLPLALGSATFHAATFEQAGAAIDAALDARVESAIQAELDKVHVVHARIDTHDESERMNSVCGGALQALWRDEKNGSPAVALAANGLLK